MRITIVTKFRIPSITMATLGIVKELVTTHKFVSLMPYLSDDAAVNGFGIEQEKIKNR